MGQKESIRKSNGEIIGFIETMSNGDKLVTNSYGKLLGRYNKAANITTNSWGAVLYRGECLSMLLK